MPGIPFRFGAVTRSSAVRLVLVVALVAVALVLARPVARGAQPEAMPELAMSFGAGVNPDAALDRVYHETNAAIMGRKLEPLGECYAPEALYLSESFAITQGRKEIVDGFGNWFKWLEEHNAKVVEAGAQVVARETVGDFAYDVGYWRLVTVVPGEGARTQVWKYSTVFRREADGRWQILVDNNMTAPAEAFSG